MRKRRLWPRKKANGDDKADITEMATEGDKKKVNKRRRKNKVINEKNNTIKIEKRMN